MIEYASEIIERLIAAADQAFNELSTPVTCGDSLPEVIREAAYNAFTGGPSGLTRRDAPIAALVEIIEQTVAVVSIIDQVSSEVAFQRAMAQTALELSLEVDRLSDPERPEQYADCSVFIQNDRFLVAANVAAAHVVATAGRSLRAPDTRTLTDFFTAEFDDGNAYMVPDVSALRAAARECEYVAS